MKVIPPITLSNTEGSFTRSTTATYIAINGTMQTAGVNTPRVTYDPITLICQGVLYEPARTNLVVSSDTPVTQNITVTNTAYTLSFYGTGTIATSGTSTNTLAGTGAFPSRVTLTFTPTAGTLTLTVTGTIQYAQLEAGAFVTSYIPSTLGTRAADTFGGSTPCLVYSNVTAPSGYTTWLTNTTYGKGDKVHRATTNCVYQCIKDITTNTTNATILPETSVLLDTPYWVRLDALPWVSGTTYTYSAISPAQVTYNNRTYEIIATTTINTTLPTSTSPVYWFDVGPSNRWGVFDYLRNSTSNIKTQMVISVSTGTRVDSLVLVGMEDIKNAVVSVYSPSLGTTTYTSFRSLTTKASSTWYDYFFTVGTTVKSAVFSNLLPYSDAIVSIVINGDNIACGGIILGKAQELGTIQRGATSEIINFSTVTRDIFGNATMVQRRNIPKTNQTLYLDKSYVNAVRTVRDQLNATPAAWIGLDDIPGQYYFESLLIVGFYRTFTINIDNPIGVIINLELEEI
jgi:hypothetical protein